MQLHKLRSGTKFLLWSLFLLQILIIGIYWLYQQGNGPVTESFLTVSVGSGYDNNNDRYVNFITKKLDNKDVSQIKLKDGTIDLDFRFNFEDDFITYTESGLDLKQNLTCFRQGTISNSYINYENSSKNIQECRCQLGWHGGDCGQPEIVWRALMTSKVKTTTNMFNLGQSPNKIIYMITGQFISLEILEIQIMQLENSVDFFIICQQLPRTKTVLTSLDKESISKKLKIKFSVELFKRILIIDSIYLKNNNSKIKGKTKRNLCTPKLAYNEFKSNLLSLDKLKANDIFIISLDDEILNRNAIKYFQYYNSRPNKGVIRFRLKFNVYGFYWQHPINTRLGSALCSIQELEEKFNSDPERLLNIKKPSMIIGDLNHIGGWFCRYCYQPSEIIDKLMIESSLKLNFGKIVPTSSGVVVFPKAVKNGQIDSSYIQNLIASGLYIDGKLGLMKQHHFSDKYYAPEYVEDNSWKFDNILVNLFLSFGDDYEYS